MEFNREQLNYFRFCYIVTDVLTEALRVTFKREWDSRYKATFGEWKDDPKSGRDLWKGESPQKKIKYADELSTMINGNRCEWNCSMLFYGILHSDSMQCLSPAVRSNVNKLKVFRNEFFVHKTHGVLSDKDFNRIIANFSAAFRALGLSTLPIQEIQVQRSFPCQELKEVLKKVDLLSQELQEKNLKLQVLEDQLNSLNPSFCYLPPRPAHEIVVRDFEVAEIIGSLKQLKSINANRLTHMYISGPPGCGKSSVALLVGERFFNSAKEISPNTAFVMTLSAESPEKFLMSYVSFARMVKCPEYAITNTFLSKDLSISEKITTLMSLISTKITHYSSWLLIVDNITSMSHVEVHFPDPGSEQWGRGQLLITTQDTNCIPSLRYFTQHFSLSRGMSVSDAHLLLAKLSGISDPKMEKKVAQVLDFNPLALASAAAYVRHVSETKGDSNFGWNELLKRLELGQLNTTVTASLGFQNEFASLSRVIQLAMKDDKIIRHTVSLLAMCAPRPLNLDVVMNFLHSLNEECGRKEDVERRLGTCSLWLLVKGKNGINIQVYRIIHDVLKTVTLKNFHEEEIWAVFCGAVRSFNQFIEDGAASDDEVVPHLETVMKATEDRSWLPQGETKVLSDVPSGFLTKLGEICQSHGKLLLAKKYLHLAKELITDDFDRANTTLLIARINADLCEFSKALSHYEDALPTFLNKLGPEHLEVAALYYSLGSVYHQLNGLSRAKEFLQQSLDIRLKKLGPNHVEVARSYNNLGSVLCDLNDVERARDYFEQALSIYLKELSPTHLDVATTYSNLGLVFRAQNDLEEAEEYLKRAFEIRSQNLGPNHICVATSLNDLGVVYCEQGKLRKGKELYDRAVSIYQGELDTNHHYVATATSNLGSVLNSMGDLQKAKEHYERALEGFFKSWGPDHVSFAKSLCAVAKVSCEMGDLSQAKSLYEESLNILQKTVGPENAYVANAISSLAFVLREIGEFEKAKEHYERALHILSQKRGSGHVEVASIRTSLGLVLLDLGDLQGAEMQYELALEIYEKTLDPEHPGIANLYNNMGVLFRTSGNFLKSKKFHEKALIIRRKRLGEKNVWVATCYNDLGLVHHELGDLAQAKLHHEKALSIYLETLRPHHLYVAHSSSNLGAVQGKLAEWKKAKENYERALISYRKTLGPKHEFVAKCCSDLACAHEKLEDYRQAKYYFEEALIIGKNLLATKHVPEHVHTKEEFP